VVQRREPAGLELSVQPPPVDTSGVSSGRPFHKPPWAANRNRLACFGKDRESETLRIATLRRTDLHAPTGDRQATAQEKCL